VCNAEHTHTRTLTLTHTHSLTHTHTHTSPPPPPKSIRTKKCGTGHRQYPSHHNTTHTQTHTHTAPDSSRALQITHPPLFPPPGDREQGQKQLLGVWELPLTQQSQIVSGKRRSMEPLALPSLSYGLSQTSPCCMCLQHCVCTYVCVHVCVSMCACFCVYVRLLAN
jgi:hypothetical protein